MFDAFSNFETVRLLRSRSFFVLRMTLKLSQSEGNVCYSFTKRLSLIDTITWWVCPADMAKDDSLVHVRCVDQHRKL